MVVYVEKQTLVLAGLKEDMYLEILHVTSLNLLFQRKTFTLTDDAGILWNSFCGVRISSHFVVSLSVGFG